MSHPTLTIACHDCGHRFETRRENTLYCSICRLVRDLPYVAGRPQRKCALCTGKFEPLDVHDPLCGECSPEPRRHGRAICAFCQEEAGCCRADVAVCNRCARDPKIRARFWNSLQNKQARRRTEARELAHA